MSVNPTIVTRVSGSSPKNEALTNAEVDTNFINLKDAIVSVGVQADINASALSTFEDTQNVVNTTINDSLAVHEDRIDTLESEVEAIQTSGEYIKKDGTIAFIGNVDAGDNLIRNVLAPVIGTDAPNKDYVDVSVSGIQAQITALNFSPYLKHDGSVPLSENLNANSKRITSLSDPQDLSDAATKKFVMDKVNHIRETRFTINDANIYSADIVSNTYAYEFQNSELCDKIIFSGNVDSDNITFPNKAYNAKVRFADTFSNFPDSSVDLKLVNRSTGKLSIVVNLNDGTKICTLPPRSSARIQWSGDSVDPVLLVTINKNHESIYNSRASNFIKGVVGVAASGTIKSNYSWIGKDSLDAPALTFDVTHTASSGIYIIAWTNNNSFNSNDIKSPVVIPTLELSVADTDDYKIYAKSVTSAGCEIHIKDSSGYIDKDFSIIVGGHNSVDGNNYNNPFLV